MYQYVISLARPLNSKDSICCTKIAKQCSWLLVAFLMTCCGAIAQSQSATIGAKVVFSGQGVMDFKQLAQQQKLQTAVSRSQSVVQPEIMRTSLPVPGTAGAFAAGLQATSAASSGTQPLTQAPFSPVATRNFAALMDNQLWVPPDTQGAVGPNDLLVVESGTVLVEYRTGGVRTSSSLDSFWSPLGSGFQPQNCRAAYDPYYNRWIMACEANANSASSALLIAVSQTPNPAGTWSEWKANSDPGYWANFPSLGFNANWVAVGMDMYPLTGCGCTFQENVYVINKAQLYNGTATSAFKFTDTSGAYGLIPAITYDNDPSRPLYLLQSWNSNPGDGYGYLRMGSIAGSASAPVLYIGPMCAVCIRLDTAWGNYVAPANGGFAPQAGTSTRIDTNDDRVRGLIYRNGTLWEAQTVFMPASSPTHAAVQWYQFDTGGSGTYQRIDDVSGVEFRAYPSIAVNKLNDALIGYSTFSASTYASAAYAFVSHRDPGFGAEPEQQLVAGRGPYVKYYGSTINKWGFYSNTAVDPVNDMDLWTIQEFASNNSGLTGDFGNWGTWWGLLEVGAARLQVSNPGTTTAGASFNVTVTAQDSSNLTVPAYGGTVHFSSSDPTAVLPADYTFTAADNGVHTFTGVILYKAGNQSVSVADAAAPATGAITVQVVPAAPKRFSWNVPLTATMNMPFNGTLTVFDNFSNIATNYTGSVQLSTTGPPAATLPTPNPYTFNSGDNGVHTFSFTATSGAGSTFTITANDAGNGVSLTSSPIRVTTDLPITGTGGLRIHMFRPNIPVLLARFTDSDGSENGTNLSATISWGDGTTDSGCTLTSSNCKIVRVGASNVFNVLGAHSYASKKMFAVTVTLNDNALGAGNGSAAAASSTATFFPINSSH